MKFNPMLSATISNIKDINYPVLVSPKLDGIRCLIQDGIAVSRNLKPIPNRFIQNQLAGLPDGLDGELIVGTTDSDTVWNATQSGVMSEDGEPNFTFNVFDWYSDQAFNDRYHSLMDLYEKYSFLKIVEHHIILDHTELSKYEQNYIDQGYEGVMIRSLDGPYKEGRSTTNEGFLMKLKRWEDDEAIITGFKELEKNLNEKTKDNLGHSKRSTHKANKVLMNTLGSFICEKNGKKFNVGSGLNKKIRDEIWNNKDKYINRFLKYKFQEKSADGIPRFPIYLGIRDERDM